MPEYQTISDFLLNPFNLDNYDRDSSYDIKYNEFVKGNKIKVVGIFKMENDYLIHVKVPSESSEGTLYDVVIDFFPPTDGIAKELTLDNYMVKFFSNSPGFVFKYAYVYKENGYFIDGFEDKLGEATTTPPSKSNSKSELGYDKSIFFAAKFLSDRKFIYLVKASQYLFLKRDWNRFVSNIASSSEVQANRNTVSKSKVEAGVKKTSKKKEPEKKPSTSTSGVKVVHAKSYTGSDNTRSVRRAKVISGSKKRPRKTTSKE